MDPGAHDSMVDHPARLALALAILVAIAILAYWWWDPIGNPAIRFDPAMAKLAAERTFEPSPQPQPDPRPIALPPAEEIATAPAVLPPSFREYTIRRGETLDGIARDQLGSAKLAGAIRRANPLKDLSRLKAGDVIRIPLDPANIQGKPTHAPKVAAAQGFPREYEVQPGDTLSKIAVKVYGSSRFTDLIFQANRPRLKSKDSVREGQKLTLPAPPAPDPP